MFIASCDPKFLSQKITVLLSNLGVVCRYDRVINTRTDTTLKTIEENINGSTKYFSGRMISTIEARKILRKNGIHVNEDEAIVILISDFLYMLAISFKKDDDLEL